MLIIRIDEVLCNKMTKMINICLGETIIKKRQREKKNCEDKKNKKNESM